MTISLAPTRGRPGAERFKFGLLSLGSFSQVPNPGQSTEGRGVDVGDRLATPPGGIDAVGASGTIGHRGGCSPRLVDLSTRRLGIARYRVVFERHS
jgi:hypothetical protein